MCYTALCLNCLKFHKAIKQKILENQALAREITDDSKAKVVVIWILEKKLLIHIGYKSLWRTFHQTSCKTAPWGFYTFEECEKIQLYNGKTQIGSISEILQGIQPCTAPMVSFWCWKFYNFVNLTLCAMKDPDPLKW